MTSRARAFDVIRVVIHAICSRDIFAARVIDVRQYALFVSFILTFIAHARCHLLLHREF
jgi:hypothetical protein